MSFEDESRNLTDEEKAVVIQRIRDSGRTGERLATVIRAVEDDAYDVATCLSAGWLAHPNESLDDYYAEQAHELLNPVLEGLILDDDPTGERAALRDEIIAWLLEDRRDKPSWWHWVDTGAPMRRTFARNICDNSSGLPIDLCSRLAGLNLTEPQRIEYVHECIVEVLRRCGIDT